MKSNERALASSASQDTTTGSSQSPEGNFAFLVHSQDSISQDTPPEIDNHQLARQKRRRTRYQLHNIGKQCLFTDCFRSPEDQAILEAEYERNSKPDKAARIDIVNRVSLGEKEVQVSKSGEFCHSVLFNTPSGVWADWVPRSGSKIVVK